LWAFHWLLVIGALVPGLLLAERASASRGRAVPYAIVVLAGSALVDALMIPLAAWIFDRHLQHSPLIIIDTTMRMGLAAFVFAAYREQREAVETVQALETKRNEMTARLAASRLSAARARVQPEVFIAELRAIRAAYVRDPAAAEVGLEALITRLRAASRSAVP
jgi:threonine/homoserine/homoserine lactone efflux protein